MSTYQRPSRYELLDIFRGLACLWIFACHAGDAFRPWGHFTRWFIDNAHPAIPVFFIISGYSMTASYTVALHKREPALAFLYRRFRRVYGTLWCALAIGAALPFVSVWLARWAWGGTWVIEAPFTAWSPWRWFRVLTLSTNTLEYIPLTGVLWSLAVEVQFYLLLALALRFRGVGKPGFVFLTLIGLPLMFYRPSHSWGTLFPFFPIIALGVALYFVDARGWHPSRLIRAGRPACAALMLALIPLMLWTIYLGPTRTDTTYLMSPAFAAVLFVWLWLGLEFKGTATALALSPWRAVRWATRLLLLLGAMSYSIYLLHLPFYGPLNSFMLRHFDPNQRRYGPLLMLLAVCLFYPFHVFCEKPFMKRRVRLPIPPVDHAAPPSSPAPRES